MRSANGRPRWSSNTAYCAGSHVTGGAVAMVLPFRTLLEVKFLDVKILDGR
jgi:hypothetical protein